MRDVVIVEAVRTPIGRFLGGLKDFTAVELGTFAVKSLLERSGIDGDAVDEVFFGNGRQAGGGPNPARQSNRSACWGPNRPRYTGTDTTAISAPRGCGCNRQPAPCSNGFRRAKT